MEPLLLVDNTAFAKDTKSTEYTSKWSEDGAVRILLCLQEEAKGRLLLPVGEATVRGSELEVFE